MDFQKNFITGSRIKNNSVENNNPTIVMSKLTSSNPILNDFGNWTSENNEIDKSIQECQRTTVLPNKNSYESSRESNVETTNNKDHSASGPVYHKLKRLRYPFPIFSNELNQFQDGKELTIKKLEILKHERSALKIEQHCKALKLNKFYKERKRNLKNTVKQNTKMHGKLSAILIDLIGGDGGTGQLNPLTVGPFLLKLSSQSAGQEI
ncbi:hypothetical protein Glove_168g187 [Diversispora epigaea]|uniref:Uncharacterized protein n=1 Tax=Diversispora epigaea TaxID=1348612 RepID=A0A397IYQ7_9GLOM|nr:hypothetical protein Glove_168g187 [Diversispora epigaea]